MVAILESIGEEIPAAKNRIDRAIKDINLATSRRSA
jgi:hypothetical protein